MVITIPLLENTHCLLKEGQKVDFETAYLDRHNELQVNIPLSKKLGIDPDKIFRYLKKLVGEKIKKGEVLAVKKGLFGDSKVLSEYDGVIQEIDHHKGELLVTTETDQKKTENCYFKGKVKEVNDREIKIEVGHGADFPIKSASDSFGGETFYFEDGFFDLSSSEISGKILITESISELKQIKAEALGIGGIVSLNKTQENPQVNFALIKNIEDLEKIKKINYPYCLVDKKNSKIIFYE